MKAKKCKFCKSEFTPLRPLQYVCSPICSINYSKALNDKKEAKEWNKRKSELKKKTKTLSDYLKETQKECNKYIRKRDENLKCISCNKEIKGVKHASHFYSSGGHSNIRFHEDNIHVSCFKCNVMLSGNQNEYRVRLIKKIGLERVEWLDENAHIEKKWNKEELRNLLEYFKNKSKTIVQ